MTQLDEFREQLRQRPKLHQDERDKPVAEEPSAPKKVRKKKDVPQERAAVWISKEVQRKVRLLGIWLDSEGLEDAPSLGDVITEAIEHLIDTKYPKAKKFVERS